MDKFIILYQKGLYGAIVGTESGHISSITKERLNDDSWIKKHKSETLRVLKISGSNTFTGSHSDINFLIDEKLEDIEQDASLEFQRVKTLKFEVVFYAYFSKKGKIWIIEEKPLILPL